jgi:hypothetical protein
LRRTSQHIAEPIQHQRLRIRIHGRHKGSAAIDLADAIASYLTPAAV